MKKTFSLLLVFAIALCALVAAQAESVSLNDATLDEIIAKAQEIGDIQSVGMPDDWANWGETWGDILETYGITHSDIDMSSGKRRCLRSAHRGRSVPADPGALYVRLCVLHRLDGPAAPELHAVILSGNL